LERASVSLVMELTPEKNIQYLRVRCTNCSSTSGREQNLQQQHSGSSHRR